ncbi:thiol reductase thioredoxin [Candidatus Atribacteria bacterium HGW-Atribacteria-1]|nr:MAG: thiol reductase thioredoxin [Candidatus Atribacteria bacterium HGW-Atribacteria-1]
MKKILLVLFLSLILFCGCTNGVIPEEPEEENKVIEVTDESWDKEVLQVKFAMVDFYSDGCSPCKELEPIVKELAKENPRLKVCKMDVMENPKTYLKYKVRGLPTLIFFKEGKEVDRIIGLKTKAYIQSRINLLLKEEEKERNKKENNCEGGVCPIP